MSGLRAKITGGYFAITVLAVLVGTLSALNYFRFSRDVNEMMVQNYQSVIAASNMVADLERQDSAVLLMLTGDGPSQALYEQSRADFLGWLARAQDNVTLPGEGDIVARVRTGYLAYTKSLNDLRESVRAGTVPAGMVGQSYRKQALPQFNETRAACQELLKANDEAMRAAQARMTAVSSREIVSTLLLALAALVLAAVLGSTISARITQPLRSLAEFARRVGRGDLDGAPPVSGADEVGVLAVEFGRMMEHLKQLRALDVAALADAKLKLEAVMNSIGDGLVIMNVDRQIESVNEAARQIFGWRDRPVVGTPFDHAVQDERLRKLAQEPAENAAEHAPVITTGREGHQRRYYQAELTTVRLQGRPVGTVLLMRDVTVVEEEDRARARFMSAVSHELRTPLASLVMGIGLLAESTTLTANPRDQKLIEVLREDSRRLSRLVEELFALTRLQVGQMPLRFADEDIPALVDLATKPFLPQAEKSGVRLSYAIAPGLPPVRADQEKITWVLSNLLGNALRYTPSGGDIRVSAELAADMVHIIVEDTGPGIAKDMREAIFKPFVQLDPLNKGGAGLGLAVARDIVRAHGGRIWVEGEPGHGSRFVFSLPVEIDRGGGAIGQDPGR